MRVSALVAYITPRLAVSAPRRCPVRTSAHPAMARLSLLCLLVACAAAADTDTDTPSAAEPAAVEGQNRQPRLALLKNTLSAYRGHSLHVLPIQLHVKPLHAKPCHGVGCGVSVLPTSPLQCDHYHPCPSGGRCHAGRCVGCLVDSDCPHSLSCWKYQCRRKSGGSGVGGGDAGLCHSSSQCGEDQYCAGGVCKPKIPAGESCQDGGLCSSGSCIHGRCAQCSQYKPCAGGESCVHGHCQAPGDIGADCLVSLHCKSRVCDQGKCAECVHSDDCDSGQFCKRGTCRSLQAASSHCDEHSECWSGLCAPGGKCADCLDDGQCSGDQYCGDSNSCRAREPHGELCRRDRDCQSGKCGEKGRCVLCRGRTECAAGQFCSAEGACERLRMVHEQCDNKEQCLSGSCGKLGFCVQCRANADCGSGQRCHWGLCAPRSRFGEVCAENSDCDTDRCRDKRCAACDQDSDCGAGMHCTDERRCEANRRNAAKCTQDKQCASGHCDQDTGDCVQCKVDRHCTGPTVNTRFCFNNECIRSLPNFVCCMANVDCQSRFCSIPLRQRNTNECLAQGRRGVCRTLFGGR